MSILDGLQPNIADTYVLDRMRGTEAWSLALDNFRKALTNPTDEKVEAIAEQVECSCEAGWADTCPIHGAARWMVRAVLAAAAGGDDEALPLHRVEAGWPHCSTCDGGGCPDCTDPAHG